MVLENSEKLQHCWLKNLTGTTTTTYI